MGIHFESSTQVPATETDGTDLGFEFLSPIPVTNKTSPSSDSVKKGKRDKEKRRKEKFDAFNPEVHSTYVDGINGQFPTSQMLEVSPNLPTYSPGSSGVPFHSNDKNHVVADSLVTVEVRKKKKKKREKEEQSLTFPLSSGTKEALESSENAPQETRLALKEDAWSASVAAIIDAVALGQGSDEDTGEKSKPKQRSLQSSTSEMLMSNSKSKSDIVSPRKADKISPLNEERHELGVKTISSIDAIIDAVVASNIQKERSKKKFDGFNPEVHSAHVDGIYKQFSMSSIEVSEKHPTSSPGSSGGPFPSSKVKKNVVTDSLIEVTKKKKKRKEKEKQALTFPLSSGTKQALESSENAPQETRLALKEGAWSSSVAAIIDAVASGQCSGEDTGENSKPKKRSLQSSAFDKHMSNSKSKTVIISPRKVDKISQLSEGKSHATGVEVKSSIDAIIDAVVAGNISNASVGSTLKQSSLLSYKYGFVSKEYSNEERVVRNQHGKNKEGSISSIDTGTEPVAAGLISMERNEENMGGFVSVKKSSRGSTGTFSLTTQKPSATKRLLHENLGEASTKNAKKNKNEKSVSGKNNVHFSATDNVSKVKLSELISNNASPKKKASKKENPVLKSQGEVSIWDIWQSTSTGNTGIKCGDRGITGAPENELDEFSERITKKDGRPSGKLSNKCNKNQKHDKGLNNLDSSKFHEEKSLFSDSSVDKTPIKKIISRNKGDDVLDALRQKLLHDEILRLKDDSPTGIDVNTSSFITPSKNQRKGYDILDIKSNNQKKSKKSDGENTNACPSVSTSTTTKKKSIVKKDKPSSTNTVSYHFQKFQEALASYGVDKRSPLLKNMFKQAEELVEEVKRSSVSASDTDSSSCKKKK